MNSKQRRTNSRQSLAAVVSMVINGGKSIRNTLTQAIEEYDEALVTLKEANEGGTLEDRLEAALELEQAQLRLDRARIDGYNERKPHANHYQSPR